MQVTLTDNEERNFKYREPLRMGHKNFLENFVNFDFLCKIALWNFAFLLN